MRAPLSSFKLNLNWKVCLFSVLLMPVLLRLGFWQLERAEQKRTIQQMLVQQQALPSQSVAKLHQEVEAGTPVLYRRVHARGGFDAERYWLIENRVFQGQTGYHVVVPFTTSEGQVLLVNRGWVAGNAYREDLPNLIQPAAELSIKGVLTQPSSNVLLQGEDTKGIAWPRVSLQADIEAYSEALDVELFSYMLQLNADDPSALTVDWRPANVSETKHLGYAYQWFAMSLALLILTVFANSNLGELLRKPH